MSQYVEKAEKMTLPLIALRDTVAFPAALLNFELTDEVDVLAAKAASSTSGLVFLVTEVVEPDATPLFEREPVDDFETLPTPDASPLYQVGTVVRIKQLVKTPEKQTRMIVEGLSRATLLSVNEGGDFPVADLMTKTIVIGDTTELRARAYVHNELEALRSLSGFLPAGADEMMHTAASIQDPGLLADFIASNLLLKTEDKQAILECYEPYPRVDLLMQVLEGEKEILACAADIHRKVNMRMAQNQKEFYLREQLRIIQDELGEGAGSETERYAKHILKRVVTGSRCNRYTSNFCSKCSTFL